MFNIKNFLPYAAARIYSYATNILHVLKWEVKYIKRTSIMMNVSKNESCKTFTPGKDMTNTSIMKENIYIKPYKYVCSQKGV